MRPFVGRAVAQPAREKGAARGVWHGVTVVATDAAGNASEARGAFRLEP